MKRTSFMIALFCAGLILENAEAKPLLFMPFQIGTYWWCPQGNGGSYTHSGNLYWAFDFNKIKSIKGPSDPAYNQPVYSPLEGTVYQVVNNIPDFQNNNGSNAANNYGWGNVVLIEDDSTGNCVRMIHFKKDSIAVQAGQHVEAGTYIGKLGMTGWSTNPHLHIHLQSSCASSGSIPFSFVEGKVTDTGDWNTWKVSELTPRGSVLDEDNSQNLGSYFSQTTIAKSGSWQAGNLISGFTGDSYLTHQVMKGDMHSFTWNFSVTKPGFYIVFAKWNGHPNRDYKTKYTVFGQVKHVNQQKSLPLGWGYIGYGYLSDTGTYQVSMQGTTPGKYVVADAIILVKF